MRNPGLNNTATRRQLSFQSGFVKKRKITGVALIDVCPGAVHINML